MHHFGKHCQLTANCHTTHNRQLACHVPPVGAARGGARLRCRASGGVRRSVRGRRGADEDDAHGLPAAAAADGGGRTAHMLQHAATGAQWSRMLHYNTLQCMQHVACYIEGARASDCRMACCGSSATSARACALRRASTTTRPFQRRRSSASFATSPTAPVPPARSPSQRLPSRALQRRVRCDVALFPQRRRASTAAQDNYALTASPLAPSETWVCAHCSSHCAAAHACAGMVKLAPDLSEIWIAHNTYAPTQRQRAARQPHAPDGVRPCNRQRCTPHGMLRRRAVVPHARAGGTQPSPPTPQHAACNVAHPAGRRLLFRPDSWSAYSDMLRITKSYSIAPHAAAAPGAAHVLFPG